MPKKLLNTKQMYVLIGARGFGDVKKPVTITFQGVDHFRADIIRPINLAETAAEGFIDAVNFGEKGSYITIADLVNPVDWRGYTFDSLGVDKDYRFLWDFYGPFAFEILVDGMSQPRRHLEAGSGHPHPDRKLPAIRSRILYRVLP